jgi:hypothetical protein
MTRGRAHVHRPNTQPWLQLSYRRAENFAAEHRSRGPLQSLHDLGAGVVEQHTVQLGAEQLS